MLFCVRSSGDAHTCCTFVECVLLLHCLTDMSVYVSQNHCINWTFPLFGACWTYFTSLTSSNHSQFIYMYITYIHSWFCWHLLRVWFVSLISWMSFILGMYMYVQYVYLCMYVIILCPPSPAPGVAQEGRHHASLARLWECNGFLRQGVCVCAGVVWLWLLQPPPWEVQVRVDAWCVCMLCMHTVRGHTDSSAHMNWTCPYVRM